MPDDWRTRPGGSGGLLARRGSAVLLVRDSDPEHEALLDELLEALDAAGDDPAPGRRLARRTARTLSATDLDTLPDLCLLARTDDGGLAALVVGDAELVVDGDERLSGRDVATWVDRILRPPVARLHASLGGATGTPGTGRVDLRDGVVTAGLVDVAVGDAPVGDVTVDAGTPAAAQAPGSGTADSPDDTREAPRPVVATASPPAEVPAQAGPPAPAAPPADRPAFVSVPLSTPLPLEERAPLPGGGVGGAAGGGNGRSTATVAPPVPVPADVPAEQDGAATVLGITCSRSHFNDPSSVYCASCGISLVHQTHNLVPGPRPPLGVLVSDDGGVYTLSQEYVLGREPENAEAVQEGRALPLVLDDPDRTLSRVHAAIDLHEWDVRVVDLGSANGTCLRRPGSQDWERLVPHEPTTLLPGASIRLGGRVLDFDSHRRS